MVAALHYLALLAGLHPERYFVHLLSFFFLWFVRRCAACMQCIVDDDFRGLVFDFFLFVVLPRGATTVQMLAIQCFESTISSQLRSYAPVICFQIVIPLSYNSSSIMHSWAFLFSLSLAFRSQRCQLRLRKAF